MNDTDILDTARTIARLTLNLDGYGRDETRNRVIEAARLSLGCTGASLWQLSRPGEARLDASTDPKAAQAAERQLAKDPQGPMWEAVTTRETVVCPDFTIECRWPTYIKHLLSVTAERSSVAYPLGTGSHDAGVLALYSEQPGYFTPAVVELGMTFAMHASIMLEKAAMRDQIENLEVALNSNRRIGMAIGVLMAQRKTTEEQAFVLLRDASQRSHVKLREIAEQVLLIGEVETTAVARSA